MIEYDKRIKDPTKILTPFSSGMNAYYGKECYCTDDLYDFRDLKVCTVDTLVDRPIINKEYQFATENGRFKYCLPSEFVEKPIKKQLRSFKTAKELPFTVGDKVYFKGKGLKPYVYTIVSALNFNSNGTLTGIQLGCSEIIDTEDLFNDYEWKFGLDSEWRPFGVEE
jgi:hypothetical protein